MAEFNPETIEESLETERKESFDDRALKTLCAFANTRGGTVFIPVSDKGKILDKHPDDREQQNIVSQIVQHLGIQPSIEYHHWQSQNFMCINVPQSPTPVSLRGRYYRRIGNTTHALSTEGLRDFILADVPWDEQLLPDATLDDLDRTEIRRFINAGKDIGRIDGNVSPDDHEKILYQLDLIKDDALTYGAMLLFGENPQKWFHWAITRVGLFETEIDIVDDKHVDGNIFHQVRRAEDIIRSYMRHGYIITDKSFVREEKWTYPLPALREGLNNSVIHRNYHLRTQEIQIKYFPHKLMIFSPGGLPKEITMEDINTGPTSVPRNKLLAKIFYRSGLIESFGSGINRIKKSLKEEGLPEPKIENLSHVFLLAFNARKNEPEVTEADLNERQVKALELAEDSPIQTKDLAEFFPDLAERTLRRDLQELVDLDFMTAEGVKRYREYILKIE